MTFRPPFISRPGWRRAALLVGWLAAGVLATGCDSLQPKAPDQVVQERAQARWDALIEGEFEQAWTYAQPGFRALVRQKDYRKRFGSGGAWRAAQVLNADCEAERCEVRVRLTTVFALPRMSRQDVTGEIAETWVREDGQWWYYQSY